MNNEGNQETLNNNEIQTPMPQPIPNNPVSEVPMPQQIPNQVSEPTPIPEPVSDIPVTSVVETPVTETTTNEIASEKKSTNFKTIIILAIILVVGIIGFIRIKNQLKESKQVIDNANKNGLNCKTSEMEKVYISEMSISGFLKDDYFYFELHSQGGWLAQAYARYTGEIVESIDSPLCSTIDGKPIVSMNQMFSDVNGLKSIDLSSFDTSNVTSMEMMFMGCDKLTSLDLSSFNTSKVTNMNMMFALNKNLKELNISSFDTSSLLEKQDIFLGCDSLPDSIKNDPRFNK